MIKYKVEFHCIPNYNDCDGEFETLDAAKLYVNKTMSKFMLHCKEIDATITGYTEYEYYELSLNETLEFDSEEKALVLADVLFCNMEKILGYKLNGDFYKKMFSISKKQKNIQSYPMTYSYKTNARTFDN